MIAALEARCPRVRTNVLARFDANGDGTLDARERVAFKADRIAAFQARRAQVVAQFDANHDGVLDDAEKLALKQAIQQRLIDGRDAE